MTIILGGADCPTIMQMFLQESVNKHYDISRRTVIYICLDRSGFRSIQGTIL